MRIARVESVVDREQACRTFERGLEETRRLSGFDRERLLEQARLLAAAVAPNLLSEIPPGARSPGHFDSEMVGRIMVDHNHRDAAYDYVMNFNKPAGFPFGCVSNLIRGFDDEERCVRLVRRAIEVWRTAEPDRHVDFGFMSLFQWAWKIIPPDDAREIAREIVGNTLSRRDSPMTARYEHEGGVTITSMRENTLFGVLHILRQLDPTLAESLIAEHQQLATAAHRFPNGVDTIREEAERRSRNAGAACGGEFVLAGNPRDFPHMKALLDASRAGDFGPSIEHALESYRQDEAPESPNQAPREFWPSTCRFRSILYRIGKLLGRAGANYLDRVPDDDLRLFGEIEFEAASDAGLPTPGASLRCSRPGKSPGSALSET
jgi:hypothetical protein